MPGAAIYCRISRDRAGAGLGVERQEKDCRALAERLGVTVAEVLVDNDLSAYSTRKKRPGYQRLLDGVKAGAYGAIIAWHPDRLHRSPIELEGFIDVLDATGIPVHTCTAGDIDLASAAGRMTARIVGAVARHESEHKSERIRRKHLELAERGLPSGGGRRYGYEADGMTIREDEAAIVREMCSRFLAGDSIYSIAQDLNQRGVKTVKGGEWHNVLIRQTIGRPRNAGLRLRKGEVYGKAAWPPILTEDIWAACAATLADPSRRTITTNTRKHLLTNIARCGVCGDGMRAGKHANTGVPIYKCKGPTTCVTRNLRSVDLLVTGYVLDLLERPSVRKLFEPKVRTGRDYSGAMASLRERKKDAAKLYARGGIDGGTLEEITRDIDVQLNQLAARAADAHPFPVLEGVGTIRERWENDLTLDRKRVIIATLVTVTVNPSRKGRGFYKESVLIERR